MNTHLIYLDLGGNHLFEGKFQSNMSCFADYLETRPQLIELHLDDTKLSGEGIFIALISFFS